MTNREVVKLLEVEIIRCRMAPKINGCPMTDDWNRTIEVCEIAIDAIKKQEQRRWIPVTFLRERKVKETGAFTKGTNKGLNISISALCNREISPAADVAPVVHAHIVVNWLGDCHCSNCGETADCTKSFCASCGANLDEPEQREE